LRILYFTRDYTPHDRRFLASLAETGNHIDYLRLEKRRQPAVEAPLPSGVEAISWSGGHVPARREDYPRLLRELKAILGEVQPDLVHAGPVQSAALLAALAGFQPLASMSWGYDLLYDVDRSAWGRQAARFTLQRSSVLVGDCQAVRQKAISLGFPAGRIVTFPWGTDLEHFQPPAGGRPEEGPFILLSTRNWEPIYGVDVLAQAFVLAAQRHLELRLVMLGNGSQEGLLQEIFEQGGVIHRVHFPGQVGREELPTFYQSAHLYTSASHTDGSSVSLLEAMACGLPAAVSDIPGNREWVEPDLTGWLFPDGDAEALAGLFLQACEERSRLAGMGLAARKVAEQRANWNANFPRLLEAYELALEGTG
jgi:L-malate glycosyltransferase